MTRLATTVAMLLLGLEVSAADLAGQVEIANGALILPNTSARTVLTITNNGPDNVISDLVGMGTSYVPNVGFRTVELFRTPETPPCTVHYTDIIAPPGQLSAIGVTILANRPLLAGEALSCVVDVFVYPEAPASFIQRFAFTRLDDDPNPANNIVDMLIRTRLPEAVALPASGWLGTLMFLAAITILAVPRLRTARNRRRT